MAGMFCGPALVEILRALQAVEDSKLTPEELAAKRQQEADVVKVSHEYWKSRNLPDSGPVDYIGGNGTPVRK